MSLLNFTTSFLFQWQFVQSISHVGDLPWVRNGGLVWDKPQPGWIKCNTDGAIFPQIRKMGYGWVIRNAIGQMMSASSRSYTGPMDAAIAEAISVHEALS